MAKPFEVYKKPHDYVNDFHKEWSLISKQYEKRTPEYFDEVMSEVYCESGVCTKNCVK